MYVLTRDITTHECPWLEETVLKDRVVEKYEGATYGCIGPGGMACCYHQNGPFFELPANALKEVMSGSQQRKSLEKKYQGNRAESGNKEKA